MTLTKKFLNPQALTSLYGGEVPLGGAEIIDVQLKRDEPRLVVKFMTGTKPLSCPDRWPKDYDVVYLSLSFIGVRGLSLTGWGHENIVDNFKLIDVDDSASVHVACQNEAAITFICDWVRIEGIVYGHIGRP